MQVNQLNPAANPVKSDSTTALKGLGDDLNTFLTMLTTQLKNQDPTNPLDTNQMTSQLVQFANVEQQIAQNKNLEDLVKLQSTNAEFGAVNFIGRQLQIEGDTTEVTSDGTIWGYQLDTPATTVDLHVVNASGVRVYSEEGDTAGGMRHEFKWNAADTNGDPVEPGKYRLVVISRDGQGKIMDGQPTIDSLGVVTGVKSNKAGPSLILGQDIEVALKEIMKIK